MELSPKEIEKLGTDFKSVSEELMKIAPNKIDAAMFINNIEKAIKSGDTDKINVEVDILNNKLCQQ